jgi:ferredoxin-nitrite reductase
MGVKVSGKEGYQVVLGGGADNDQGLGRELISSIRFVDLPAKLERLFAAYVSEREPGETFLSFTRRHDIATLQSFCNRENA